MSTQRIRHTAKFKFQIALEAVKSDKTINQLASDYQLHPSRISQWKKQFLEQEAAYSPLLRTSNNASKMTESRICMSILVG